MAHRILIIDDEEDIRTVAAMALDVHPEMDVRTCGSGTEGIEIAKWWQPDLTLLDVRMPGLTGPDTLKALRSDASTASIPVIFFTASVQKHEMVGLVELGAHGLISKPFAAMALAGQIKPFLPSLATKAVAAAVQAETAGTSDHVLAGEEPMKSLLYVSRSLLGDGEADIEVQKIVATAVSRNGPLDITGALIFTHTHFAQYLEGPSAAVDQLMAAIREDSRHGDVRIVSTATGLPRHFAEWSMAYGGSSLFVSNLVKNAFDDPSATADAQKLVRLMREFTNRVREAA